MNDEFASYGSFEISGVIFALISVVLAIRENRWCWPAAIISSVAYVPTFYFAKLYTEVVLQFFFIYISCIGWKNWGKSLDGATLIISELSFLKHFKLIAVFGGASLVMGLFLETYSNASFPYPDSAITIFSVVASFLQARKIIENWIYWILIDVGAVLLYIKKGLVLTSGLYGLYLALALLGYIEWRRTFKKQNESTNFLKR